METTESQFKELKKFAKIYKDGLNFVSQIAFENQITNKTKLHKIAYLTLRETLPSQASCSIFREVTSKYKSAISNKQKIKNVFKFGANSISFQYNRDFSFNKEKLSIKTLTGRIKLAYHGLYKHIELMNLFKIGGGVLHFDKRKVYLIVTVEVPIEYKNSENYTGIDVGQRKLAVTIDKKENIEMFSGEKVKRIKDRYAKIKSELQKKGTRSAKRRLKNIAGRERRFVKDVNHRIAKAINQNNVIVMENLLGIRKSIENRSKKTDSEKMKSANRKKSQWSFAELQFYISYKANLNGFEVIYVDPYMTSRTCPECTHEEKDNRKGELFLCKVCGYTDDADVVGSKNVLMRGIYFMGQLSNVPNATNVEIKAWWRSRYQELKWSLVASLSL